VDNAMLYWGVGGNIGDRETVNYKGYNYGVFEGQYTKAIRLVAHVPLRLPDRQRGPDQHHTDRAGHAFANPSFTSIHAPNGPLGRRRNRCSCQRGCRTRARPANSSTTETY